MVASKSEVFMLRRAMYLTNSKTYILLGRFEWEVALSIHAPPRHLMQTIVGTQHSKPVFANRRKYVKTTVSLVGLPYRPICSRDVHGGSNLACLIEDVGLGAACSSGSVSGHD